MYLSMVIKWNYKIGYRYIFDTNKHMETKQHIQPMKKVEQNLKIHAKNIIE